MNTIRDFLTAYADRYPDKIKDREKFIKETNSLFIDYADGVFSFYTKFSPLDVKKSGAWISDMGITGSGGHNGSLFEDEEYFYVWDNFIRTCHKFAEWYENLKLSHKDFMEINVSFHNTETSLLGTQEISTKFTFYEGLEDLNDPIQGADAYINSLLEKEEVDPHVVASDEEIKEVSSNFTLKSDVWYDVSPHNYLDSDSVVLDIDLLMTDSIYLQHLGSGDCYNLIIHLKDGWNKVIEHCAPIDICYNTIYEYFEIEKISDNQDKPIKEDIAIDRRVRPDEISINKGYEVRAINRCGDFGNIKFLSLYKDIRKNTSTISFDDNLLDECYTVWGGLTKNDIWAKKLFGNCSFEDCKNFIFNYFHVMELDNV